MTTHFVNILTWKHFLTDNNSDRKIYIDGFILSTILKFFKYKHKKVSGLVYYSSLDTTKSGFILNKKSNIKNSIECPFWNSVEDVRITDEILSFVAKYEEIIIGISSPKQDELSFLLNQHFPKKTFYCLGAALYSNPFFLNENLFNTWFSMFFSNPKRTLYKLYLSFKALKHILINKNEQLNFKKFIKLNLK